MHRLNFSIKTLSPIVLAMFDAVFGKEKFRASRVYFENSTPENFSTLPESTRHPQIPPNISTPSKITSRNAVCLRLGGKLWFS